jgi:hypothetical protein
MIISHILQFCILKAKLQEESFSRKLKILLYDWWKKKAKKRTSWLCEH